MQRRALIIGAGLVLGGVGCGGSRADHTRSPQPGAINGPIKYLGSAQTIVRSVVPGGPVYSIVGQRYRFSDHEYLELTIHYAEPQRVREGSSFHSTDTETVEWGMTSGCERRPFVIVYGVLKEADDVVLARRSHKLVPFKRAPLPPLLHYGGTLVYDASSKSSITPIVRTHAGDIVAPQFDVGAASASCGGSKSNSA